MSGIIIFNPVSSGFFLELLITLMRILNPSTCSVTVQVGLRGGKKKKNQKRIDWLSRHVWSVDGKINEMCWEVFSGHKGVRVNRTGVWPRIQTKCAVLRLWQGACLKIKVGSVASDVFLRQGREICGKGCWFFFHRHFWFVVDLVMYYRREPCCIKNLRHFIPQWRENIWLLEETIFCMSWQPGKMPRTIWCSWPHQDLACRSSLTTRHIELAKNTLPCKCHLFRKEKNIYGSGGQIIFSLLKGSILYCCFTCWCSLAAWPWPSYIFHLGPLSQEQKCFGFFFFLAKWKLLLLDSS